MNRWQRWYLSNIRNKECDSCQDSYRKEFMVCECCNKEIFCSKNCTNLEVCSQCKSAICSNCYIESGSERFIRSHCFPHRNCDFYDLQNEEEKLWEEEKLGYDCPHNPLFCKKCYPANNLNLPLVLEMAIIFNGKLPPYVLLEVYSKLNEDCWIDEHNTIRGIQNINNLIDKIRKN